MGVPVLTKKGTNFVSRCGESINLNLGFKNLIAESEEDYISKAVSLNLDRANLSKMRLSMRQLAMKSPLFDTHSFGEDFSNLIKNVWKKYLNKKI